MGKLNRNNAVQTTNHFAKKTFSRPKMFKVQGNLTKCSRAGLCAENSLAPLLVFARHISGSSPCFTKLESIEENRIKLNKNGHETRISWPEIGCGGRI
jgi:hypothetical protein